MSRSTDPGHFFQTDASEATRARRVAKSGNKNGNPIVLQSKILSAIADPFSTSCIYIAESAGCVRKVDIEVGMMGVIKTTVRARLMFSRLEIRRRFIEAQQHLSHPSRLEEEEEILYLQDVGTKIFGPGIGIAECLVQDTRAILTL